MSTTTHWDKRKRANNSNFIGFAEGQLVGVFRVLNPKTCKISLTHGVTFLQKSYGNWDDIEKPTFVQDNEDDKMGLANNKINDIYDFCK